MWTTGAWLIFDHLATQDAAKVKRLERAIERGLIRWHALPFTTHSELMSADLFRAGLSYAQELDRRFNQTTTAASVHAAAPPKDQPMTAPGHCSCMRPSARSFIQPCTSAR